MKAVNPQTIFWTLMMISISRILRMVIAYSSNYLLQWRIKYTNCRKALAAKIRTYIHPRKFLKTMMRIKIQRLNLKSKRKIHATLTWRWAQSSLIETQRQIRKSAFCKFSKIFQTQILKKFNQISNTNLTYCSTNKTIQ